MAVPRVVLDTNVLVAAMRSRRGAAYKLLSLATSGLYEVSLSVPLLFEYEDVLLRQHEDLLVDREKIGDILDRLCDVAEKYHIFFLWRPFLRDPKDEFVLELAVASRSRYIVTYNRRDFRGYDKFEVEIVTPKEMLRELGVE